jgi:signal transduction histidine kinase
LRSNPRARIVAAGDEARRRIERDLHDGAQQHLVALVLALRLAQASVPAQLSEPRSQIGRVAQELDGVIEELREIAHGIHPAILSQCRFVQVAGGGVPVEMGDHLGTNLVCEVSNRARSRTPQTSPRSL